MTINFKITSHNRRAKALLLFASLACLVLTGAKLEMLLLNFDTPVNLGSSVNGPANEATPNISPDGLLLFFGSDRSGGSGGWDLWLAKRESVSDSWSTPVNLGPSINTTADETSASISADQLTLFFSSNRMGGYGGFDLWMVTRAMVDDPWSAPVNLGPTVNSFYNDGSICLSSTGLELYFGSERTDGMGDSDLWMTARATTEDDWDEPVNLGKPVNIAASDGGPSISADGLTLLFDSSRRGGYPGDEIWITRRITLVAPWGEPVNLGSIVNSKFTEAVPSISSDGRELFFQSNRPDGYGNSDIWVAIRK